MNKQKKNYFITREQLMDLNDLQKGINYMSNQLENIVLNLNNLKNGNLDDHLKFLEKINNISNRLENNMYFIQTLVDEIEEQKL